MRILVDTNVLLRRGQPASHHHRDAVDSLQALVVADAELCLLPQVIYEYWVVATRPIAANGLGMGVELVQKAVEELLRDFVLFRDERGVFDRWQSLVVTHRVLGKNAHDARLVAAMRRHGLTNLVTFNQPDFSRFSGINVLSPSEILAGRIPVN